MKLRAEGYRWLADLDGVLPDEAPGIVITDGMRGEGEMPRISAFIWGGKVKSNPTLPFGRWKEGR